MIEALNVHKSSSNDISLMYSHNTKDTLQKRRTPNLWIDLPPPQCHQLGKLEQGSNVTCLLLLLEEFLSNTEKSFP